MLPAGWKILGVRRSPSRDGCVAVAARHMQSAWSSQMLARRSAESTSARESEGTAVRLLTGPHIDGMEREKGRLTSHAKIRHRGPRATPVPSVEGRQ